MLARLFESSAEFTILRCIKGHEFDRLYERPYEHNICECEI